MTPAGAQELAEWLRTPPDLVPPPRDGAHDQGARRPAGSRDRRPRNHAGAPPPRDRGHAALHPGQGSCRGGRRGRWRSSPMPSSSGSKPSCAGSMPPTSAWSSGRPPRRPRVAGIPLEATDPMEVSPMTSALELRRVSKVYGSGPTEVRALRDVDLSVERGELVAIMGPSGSGKSTLFTIAGSLEQATGGEVLVDGVDLATWSRSGAGADATPVDRLRLPGLQPAPRADGGRERCAAPRARRGRAPRPAGATGVEAMEELDVAAPRRSLPRRTVGR